MELVRLSIELTEEGYQVNREFISGVSETPKLYKWPGGNVNKADLNIPKQRKLNHTFVSYTAICTTDEYALIERQVHQTLKGDLRHLQAQLNKTMLSYINGPVVKSSQDVPEDGK